MFIWIYIIYFRSSVGPDFAKAKAIFFLVVTIILLIIGGILAYFTYAFALSHNSYLIIHIG